MFVAVHAAVETQDLRSRGSLHFLVGTTEIIGHINAEVAAERVEDILAGRIAATCARLHPPNVYAKLVLLCEAVPHKRHPFRFVLQQKTNAHLNLDRVNSQT